MADIANNLFGIHAAALSLHEARLNVLASNIANVDTPNYKARDIDFAKALEDATKAAAAPGVSATEGKSERPTAPGAASDGTDITAALRYRIPVQSSLDGNTVDAEFEHAAFAKGALEYRASLSFISARAHTLMTAITGN
jgi:flagellar basal-body rod protein FlgB